MNNITTVYLDYIKMIEVKEQASKDAPTEEVKNNVTKIYNEVTSGGVFSSLTGWIPGMFGRRGANSGATGNPNTAGPSSSAVPASQAASSSSLPQFHQSNNQIRIQGLPTDASKEKIGRFFGSIGAIKKQRIYIYKDRNSGKSIIGEATVTYEDSNAAQRAINKFNGMRLNGKLIKVSMDYVKTM